MNPLWHRHCQPSSVDSKPTSRTRCASAMIHLHPSSSPPTRSRCCTQPLSPNVAECAEPQIGDLAQPMPLSGYEPHCRVAVGTQDLVGRVSDRGHHPQRQLVAADHPRELQHPSNPMSTPTFCVRGVPHVRRHPTGCDESLPNPGTSRRLGVHNPPGNEIEHPTRPTVDVQRPGAPRFAELGQKAPQRRSCWCTWNHCRSLHDGWDNSHPRRHPALSSHDRCATSPGVSPDRVACSFISLSGCRSTRN